MGGGVWTGGPPLKKYLFCRTETVYCVLKRLQKLTWLQQKAKMVTAKIPQSVPKVLVLSSEKLGVPPWARTPRPYPPPPWSPGCRSTKQVLSSPWALMRYHGLSCVTKIMVWAPRALRRYKYNGLGDTHVWLCGSSPFPMIKLVHFVPASAQTLQMQCFRQLSEDNKSEFIPHYKTSTSSARASSLKRFALQT